MFDAHCHIGFSADPLALAQCIQKTPGFDVLCASVSCEEYRALRDILAATPSVHLAAGLHPWWIDSDEQKALHACAQLLEYIEDAAESTKLVGEVGLDFAPAHVHTADAQVAIMQRIAQTCAQTKDAILTLHSVRATTTLLDLLEQTRCTQTCTCIMHWFSGTSDELQHAIQLGCYFSVGARMLASKRGRAYVQAIPQGRLLIETDLPEENMSAENRKTCDGMEKTCDAKHFEQKSTQEATPINTALENAAPKSEINSNKVPDEQVQQEFDTLLAALERAYQEVNALAPKHTKASIEKTAHELFAGRHAAS